MNYVDTEAIGNTPAWRVALVALVLFLAAVAVGIANSEPRSPQWVDQSESEPVQTEVGP